MTNESRFSSDEWFGGFMLGALLGTICNFALFVVTSRSEARRARTGFAQGVLVAGITVAVLGGICGST